MQMKPLVALLVLCLSAGSVGAVTYTRADSLKVVQLLEKGKKQPAGTNMPLFFAGELKGLPYVAATLEEPNSRMRSVATRISIGSLR